MGHARFGKGESRLACFPLLSFSFLSYNRWLQLREDAHYVLSPNTAFKSSQMSTIHLLIQDNAGYPVPVLDRNASPTSLPPLFRNTLHTPLPHIRQQRRQRNSPRQRQPHIPPHPNRHASIIMAIKLIMLVRSNSRCNVVKHGCSYHSLRIRQRAASFRCSGRGHRVGEAHEDQGECDEAPAVVADVVEFEVVGREIGLRGRAEPADYHDGIVDPAQASQAIPECCAVGVGVEDL
jgi:hypothetical protein